MQLLSKSAFAYFRQEINFNSILKALNIAIFASGSGSNAKAILEHFSRMERVKVKLLLSNKANAGAILHAESYGVSVAVTEKSVFYDCKSVLELLSEHSIDLIVLAGFLLKIPNEIVASYSGRMINIHPALLPKFGGAGMYGKHVHEAVKKAGELRSGITIHLVNEHFDEGKLLFQATVNLVSDDTPESIAGKVQQLEQLHFPRVLEYFCLGL